MLRPKEAVRGIKYIVHIASKAIKSNVRLMPNRSEAHIIQPALRGTVGMLEAALKVLGIKGIVITLSSFLGVRCY